MSIPRRGQLRLCARTNTIHVRFEDAVGRSAIALWRNDRLELHHFINTSCENRKPSLTLTSDPQARELMAFDDRFLLA